MSEEAPATTTAAAGGRAPWRKQLAPYAQASLGRSVLDLATSILPYAVLFYAMYLSLDVSYWLTLALGVPASGFLLRTYIVFHDCTHGSFMPTKKANNVIGSITGLVAYSNFLAWRHSHAVHHASAGDLDRRGEGDVPTMTVDEWLAAPRGQKVLYWLFRHPAILFTIGPLYSLVIQPRLVSKTSRPRIKRNVHLTNLALALMIALLCWAMGWQEFLLVQAPMVFIAGSAGVFLFFVQHQFEDVYWESSDNWAYADAALHGSSYLKLPKVLQFFSGNIGLHHVHHLSARIPNYNLQRAHDENPDLFGSVPVLTLWQAIKSVRLKLIDDDTRRLVTFADARRKARAGAATPASSPVSAPSS